MKLAAALLLLLAPMAGAQTLTTLNENLWATNNAFYLDTNTNYLVLGGSATIPSNLGFSASLTGIHWADGSITTSAASGSGGGGLSQAYTRISTGSIVGPFTLYTQRSSMTFDKNYFTATDSAAAGTTFISLGTGTAGTGWTRTVYISGSGTYTPPAGVDSLLVEMVGGGGGGGGAGGSAASSGTLTSFNGIIAVGGAGGGPGLTGSTGGSGGYGGTGGTTTNSVIYFPGGGGSGGPEVGSVLAMNGGAGGNSCFGGGGSTAGGQYVVGGTGGANTGGGGGGASGGGSAGNSSGGGGGSGACVEYLISSVGASYAYSVGAGAPGAAGSAAAGGQGATGIVIINEMYPAIAPQGATGLTATVAVTSATAVSSTTAPGVYNIGVATAADIGFYIPSGADGAKGAAGTNGTNGTNGLLTFAGDIAAYWVILSTSGAKTYALTAATDGALVLTSTTTAAAFYAYPNATRKYLSNGSFTSLITADDSDGVLRMKQNTVTLRITDLAVYDSGNVVWDIGMDADGVIRTTNSGGL